MSAWDEVNDGLKDGTADAGKGEGDAFENHGDGLPSHDDPSGFAATEETVEDAAVIEKKKGPNPKLIAGVLGVVTVVIVGFIGSNIYKNLMPVSDGVLEPIAATAPETTLSSTEPAVVDATTPTLAALNQSTSQPAVSAEPAPASQPDAAIQTPSPQDQVVAALQPQAAAVSTEKAGQLENRVDTLDKRVSEMESTINSLNRKITTSSVAPSVAKQHATSPVQKKSKVAKSSAPSEVAKPQPVALELKLKGVYPPQGPDQQAWILNPKNDAITVVSKGSMVEGARVLSIQSDRIVTDKGFIN